VFNAVIPPLTPLLVLSFPLSLLFVATWFHYIISLDTNMQCNTRRSVWTAVVLLLLLVIDLTVNSLNLPPFPPSLPCCCCCCSGNSEDWNKWVKQCGF
jgi:hypothetical protein